MLFIYIYIKYYLCLYTFLNFFLVQHLNKLLPPTTIFFHPPTCTSSRSWIECRSSCSISRPPRSRNRWMRWFDWLQPSCSPWSSPPLLPPLPTTTVSSAAPARPRASACDDSGTPSCQRCRSSAGTRTPSAPRTCRRTCRHRRPRRSSCPRPREVDGRSRRCDGLRGCSPSWTGCHTAGRSGRLA